MGARTSGREAALQMLFALDISGGGAAAMPQLVTDYWAEVPGDVEGRPYADELVLAAAADLDRIDELISAASRHWRLERMARVDRNILRIGVHELTRGTQVPRPVIIDEAVELAKRYGGEGLSLFVNGVLDRIAEELGR
ncbi:MAG: transcription antitermination factor NusB [Deltaproteobacteria bacterium]|nr:MAG: transcription antitermination factor NusB [Deltaproteobacteria bacterium]